MKTVISKLDDILKSNGVYSLARTMTAGWFILLLVAGTFNLYVSYKKLDLLNTEYYIAIFVILCGYAFMNKTKFNHKGKNGNEMIVEGDNQQNTGEQK